MSAENEQSQIKMCGMIFYQGQKRKVGPNTPPPDKTPRTEFLFTTKVGWKPSSVRLGQKPLGQSLLLPLSFN